MPTPSKFTAARREQLLEGADLGLSRLSNAQMAGIDEATLRRWLTRGKTAAEGSIYGQFRADYLAAEARPKARALRVVQNAWADKPDLAWKFIERREPGYAPPMPTLPSTPSGPVTIQLAFSSRNPLELAAAEVIEGEVVDEQDVESGAAPTPA